MPRSYFCTFIALCTLLGFVGHVGSARADTVSDHDLRTRIETQTRADERLAGTDVAIAVEDGQVVLSGTVRLYSQKLHYEQLVWRTLGVEEVDNEIRVVPRYGQDDTEIKQGIRAIIAKHPWLHKAGIAVDVAGGVVRLRGTFHTPANVLSLRRLVAEIEGVTQLEINARFAT